MATQLQMRRGTQSEHSSFTGAEGEVSVNTTNDSLHVHDGSTASGFELARVDGSNWAITNAISTTANISFGDNDKAIFGAGDDLEIYHSGSHSFISDVGTGNLYLQAADSIILRTAGVNISATFTPTAGVDLNYTGSTKLATTSTGIDVTGTATMDGLTVDGTANFNSNNVVHTAATPNYVLSESDVTDENTQFLQASGTLRIRTVDDSGSNVAERLRIDHGTGDISFYNSSGTSQSLFWDSSAQSLGIGTSSPDANLHVFKGESGGATPNSQSSLVLENNSNTYLQFLTPATNESGMLFGDNDNDRGGLTYNHSSDFMAFRVAAAERMRIGSSGVLSVANTTTAYGLRTTSSLTGMSYTPTDYLTVASSGVYGLAVNRLSSDGDLIHFGKDGTTVGSIGVNNSTNLYIGSDGETGLKFGATAIVPADSGSSGASSDGDMSLGNSGTRFNNLFLSGNVIASGTPSSTVVGVRVNNSGSNFDLINTSCGSATTTKTHILFTNGNGNVGTIQTNGSATSYNTSSDYRLKENIIAMSGATERLKQLAPKRFNFIADADTTVDGFLAHEVQDIVPEAISGTKDAMIDEEYEVTPEVLDDEGNVITEAVMGTRSVPDYQGIDQSKLVPLLVAAIQELEARITQLEN